MLPDDEPTNESMYAAAPKYDEGLVEALAGLLSDGLLDKIFDASGENADDANAVAEVLIDEMAISRQESMRDSDRFGARTTQWRVSIDAVIDDQGRWIS